jgi:hypothetical protein
VILAENFNPSITTVDWLLSKVLVEETDRPKEFLNTPVFSLFGGAKYKLTIDSNRAQLALQEPRQETVAGLLETVSTLVKKLPETPYRAVGINLVWSAALPGRTAAQTAIRGVLGCNGGTAERALGSGKYGIEAVLTSEYRRYRLRVRLASSDEGNFSLLNLDFNYHSDVSSFEECIASLEEGSGLVNHSYDICQRLMEEGQ